MKIICNTFLLSVVAVSIISCGLPPMLADDPPTPTASAGRWEILLPDYRECPASEEGWKVVRIEIAVENKTCSYASAYISTKDALLYTDLKQSYPVDTLRTTGSISTQVTEISFSTKLPRGYRMTGEYRGDAVTVYAFQTKIPVGATPSFVSIPGYAGNIPVKSDPINFPRGDDAPALRTPTMQIQVPGKARITVGTFERKSGWPTIHDWISAPITITNEVLTANTTINLQYLPIGDDGIVGAPFTDMPVCQPQLTIGPNIIKSTRICAIIPHTAKNVHMLLLGDTTEVYDTQVPNTPQ